MENILIGIIIGAIIVFLIYLGFLIWTLVDVIKKDGGGKWITLIILGFVLSLILGIIGLIYGVVVMIVWWTASRKKERKTKKEKKNLSWLWILLIVLAIIIGAIIIASILSGNQASIAATQKYPFWYR